MPDDLPGTYFACAASISTFLLFTARAKNQVSGIALDDRRNQLHHFFHALHLLLVTDTIFVSFTPIIYHDTIFESILI